MLERLGTGTQGAVYLGELEAELGFRRKVAVKIVQGGSTNAERATKSLANEARALAAAHHPNVVLVYDLVRIEREYLLVMEYVEGPTLSFAIRQLARQVQTLSVSEALLVAEQMAEGLACVHGLTDNSGAAAPIIHRDLKPSNVILSRHGQVKLVDFGLAKGRLVAFHTIAPNITRGTPGYMSPEQVRGEELTPASDQFALGAILYEMVTGMPLFHGESEHELLRRVIEGRPSSDPETLRQVCPDLFPVVVRCLSLDPAQRFSATEELADALRRLRRQRSDEVDLRDVVARLEGRAAPPSSAPEFLDVPFPGGGDGSPPPGFGGPHGMGQGTESFFFGDRDTAPELEPLFDAGSDSDPAPTDPAPAVPPGDEESDGDGSHRFRDMMTYDVSFHMAGPVGKKMSFSKPKTELFGPSKFDLEPVEADDPDSLDSDEDLLLRPPWEFDD